MTKFLSMFSFFAALSFTPEVNTAGVAARGPASPIESRAQEAPNRKKLRAEPRWSTPINSLEDLGEAVHFFMENNKTEGSN